ncbi:MAG: M1 family metallopeptidase [Bacteroidota bacterium]|nr:M1 family metallopeptidase [Bacteroidota bacterium]
MRQLFFLFALFSIVTASAQNLRSGGVLKPEQANMDIRHYTIALDVDPAAKTIDGYAEIRLALLQPSRQLLLDLWHGLTISQVSVNGKAQPFTHGKDDLIRINLAQALPVQQHTVKIAYGGTPGIAQRPPWVGGFQWEKDAKGNPWISVSCQMEGGKIYFPCKDHPSDEPNEGADMLITVPKGLVATGPGLLQSTKTKGNKVTYHWKTQYPISNYCLVFNAADYAVVKRTYTTIDGNNVPMDYYVLQENKDKAEKLLDLYEQSARILEKYFGEFPWAKERMGMSETPHLGMEHQTNIAYGNKYRYQKIGGKDFDWLLHHEFGHEWWANKVTNKDWAHMWIQEGICTFGDAMATRELAGEDTYLQRMKATAMATQNRYPVVRGEEVDSDSTYHGDIYGKGAFFMHTLRYVMGDEIFFPTLKKLATDPQYTYYNTVTTADVEKLFSTASGKNLKPLFDFYLYTTNKLEIGVKETGDKTYEIRLLNFESPLPVEVKLSSGTQRMELGKTGVKVTTDTAPVVDEKVFYLKKVIYE